MAKLSDDERRAYWGAIETLLPLARRAKLTVTEAAVVAEISEEHGWDGLSCSCGGGWLMGHANGCPESRAALKDTPNGQ